MQSVERAITLLQSLAESGPARVTELAAELGVHKSNVSRLLATLERRGIVDRTEDGSRFMLGNGVALLAASAARPRPLADRSRPILAELVQAIGETVNINVLTNDGHVLTVEQVVGSSGLMGFNWVGQRSSAVATSAGKALLAHLPDSEVKRLLPRRFPRPTPNTLDRQAFLAQLPIIRSQGFATSRDELEMGLSAVAAPVFDNGGVVASITASGPTVRIFGDDHAAIVASIVAAAQQLSVRLGSRPAADQ